ncbi:type I 3-dehydroquinate dehydratase [Halostagnicola kamekurae]|uniref:3-dehydroquinate dehydratase n=1 Tax=Halostagnicola kamekurae TaxID=619731 RepID=A0A1I6TLJ4_9EURY|nr:type I 3-dehydroquinate dehydratase [Halostagnicola kamekurae]SFS90079.1 3-dehydroquinate dehydratase [Halostagnicola kamekurae]
MDREEFALAATTNDLTRETEARGTADVIEFRMDKADEPLAQLEDYDGELPIIATNRSQWFGGNAIDHGRLDRLMEAARSDAVEMVDIELETARGKEWVLEEFRETDIDLIISFHEFEETPDQSTLDAIIEECARYGDIAKVATFANDQTDTLRMLTAINSATENGIQIAGISMGEIGSHVRVLGPLYGSKLGYAPLETDTSEYAPGQISLQRLRSLIEAIKQGEAATQIIDGVDGKTPASHGFSQTD